MSDSLIKRATDLCYNAVPEAVETHPGASPETIAYGLVSRMSDVEVRAMLETLVAQRVKTAQTFRAHRRHVA